MTRKKSAAIKILLAVSCVFFSTIQPSPAASVCVKTPDDIAKYSVVNSDSVQEEKKPGLSEAFWGPQALRKFSSWSAANKKPRPAAPAAVCG
ncbi:MAG: hypothetical protein Q7R35_02485 [Elusimicrobiota bacterium]|nr:hypothetical protein [Elusimicrobiota bacterium]